VRQGYDIHQADIAFARLDSTDVVSMQFRQFCQPFLGKSALRPQFANAIAKCHTRVRASHLKPMVKALNTMSLHTMSVIYKRGGP
jgi:hypothetical protein